MAERPSIGSYAFNWSLNLDIEFQRPFKATHENMAQLSLRRDQPLHQLACNLRRALSGIVSGNIKEEGMRRVEEHGPFKIRGDKTIMEPLDQLLRAFVAQQRMTIQGREYKPCYSLIA